MTDTVSMANGSRLVTVIRDDTDLVATTEVTGEMTVGDLKSVIADDIALSPTLQALFYLGVELSDDAQTIGNTTIEENSMLTVSRKPRPQQSMQPQDNGPTSGEAEELRRQALANPNALAQLREQWPELADAVNDSQIFAHTFRRKWLEKQQERQRMEREMAFMEANPTAENQQKILDYIRLQQVEENRQAALENLPMAFGSVTMLYVPAKVGTVEISAFVDSGAQTTIMSPQCAERCGINHLIDKRYQGMARGVGTAKIVGRVHIANLVVGGRYLPCSFTVIEDASLEFLLGLDMLKRHHASIDLQKNVLRIPGEDGGEDTEVAFLPESEIPKPDDSKVAETKEAAGAAGARKAGATTSGAATGASTGSVPAVGGSSAAASLPPPVLTTPGSSSRASAAADPSPNQLRRDQVKQLVETFGCSEREAQDALLQAGGDIEVAAGMLSGFI